MSFFYEPLTVAPTTDQALIEAMEEMTRRILVRLQALLSGQRVDQSDLQSVVCTREGQGLMVSVSVTPLDATQVVQVLTQNIAEGQA